MSVKPDWQLELGGEVIAQMVGDRVDYPWIYSKLVDDSRFNRFRVYFSDVDDGADTTETESLFAEVHSKGGFILRDLRSGEAYDSFRLNQEDEVVWFRY